MAMQSALLAWSILAAASPVQVEFQPLMDAKLGRVTIRIPAAAKEFRMPAWMPGDYEIFNYGKRVKRIDFRLKGKPAPAFQGEDVNLWKIPDGADAVVYEVEESGGNFSPNLRIRPNEVFVSGGGVFGWFPGHEGKPIQLEVLKPQTGWLHATSMAARLATAEKSVMTAKDYDELIDSPFVVGPKVEIDEFKIDGIPHQVARYGQAVDVDPAKWIAMCRTLVNQTKTLFGELPYPKYVFLCDFRGGYGGLEHAQSARLGLFSPDPLPSATFVAHEFMHAYNIKIIRPKVLGPFDLTKPAITGLIWWMEGVTDYYAYVNCLRAGLISEETFLNSVGRTAWRVQNSSASKTVSIEESSRRVWEVRGSQGYGGVSYYSAGLAAGLTLDLELRQRTKGKKSLDDVIKQLYQETRRGQPGISEDRIREVLIQHGGAEMGPRYDQILRAKPITFGLEGLAPKIGLKVLQNGNLVKDSDASPEIALIRDQWTKKTSVW